MSRLTDALLDNLNKSLGTTGVSLDHLQRITQGLTTTFQRMTDQARNVLAGMQQQVGQQATVSTGQTVRSAPKTIVTGTPTGPGGTVVSPFHPSGAPARVLPPPLPTPLSLSPFSGMTQAVRETQEAITRLGTSITAVVAKISSIVALQARPQKTEAEVEAEKRKKEREAARKADDRETEGDALAAADATMAVATGGISAAIAVATAVIAKFTDALKALANSTQAIALGDASKILAPVTAVADRLIGVFAGAASQTQRFAAALNPTSALVFDQAMRDLHATIGVAMLPVFQSVTNGLRRLGEVLLPAMERLQPAFAQIASGLDTVWRGLANTVGSVLQSLQPLITFAAGVVEALAPIAQAMQAIFAGVVKAFAGLFSDDGLKSTSAELRKAFQNLAYNTIALAATFAVWLGKLTGTKIGSNFIEGVKQSLTGEGVAKKDNTGLAAAQNAQVTDFSSFSRMLTQSALLAGAAPAEDSGKQTVQALGKLISQLDGIKDDKSDFIRLLTRAIGVEMEKIINNVLEKTGGKIYEGASVPMKAFGAGMSAVEAVTNPSKTVARLLGLE